MQLKFLTLGFISAAVFSNVAFAEGHGSVVNLEDTNIHIEDVLTNILNNLDLDHLLENANVDAVGHVASEGGDHHHLSRRKLNDALRRREWERDENENEPDEEEEDEDEEDEDENEPDEEEEDEDEEDEDENEADEEEEDEDEADESSVAKVARRSVEEQDEDMNAEDEQDEEEEEEYEEEPNEDEEEEEYTEESNEDEEEEQGQEEEEEEGEEQDKETVRMARRGVPGLDVVTGALGGSSKSGASGNAKGSPIGGVLAGAKSVVGAAGAARDI
jgi:hypothetical protein